MKIWRISTKNRVQLGCVNTWINTSLTFDLGPKPSHEPEDWWNLESWRPKSKVSEVFYSWIFQIEKYFELKIDYNLGFWRKFVWCYMNLATITALLLLSLFLFSTVAYFGRGCFVNAFRINLILSSRKCAEKVILCPHC